MFSKVNTMQANNTNKGSDPEVSLVGSDLEYAYLSNGWGWDEPGNWAPGIYRVEVLINGAKVAEKTFSIYADY